MPWRQERGRWPPDANSLSVACYRSDAQVLAYRPNGDDGVDGPFSMVSKLRNVLVVTPQGEEPPVPVPSGDIPPRGAAAMRDDAFRRTPIIHRKDSETNFR